MNKKLLNDILHIESCSYQEKLMQDFIRQHAHEKGYDCEEDSMGNIYLTKGLGDTYPCMVAHMDTVHRVHGHGISLITVGTRMTGIDATTMRQTGIGGDDKCGIYAALACMEELPLCKAAFFVCEEVGCLGSMECDLTFFNDCRFVLQADRRGNKDFVDDICGPLSSRRFLAEAAPILKKFGYSRCTGMMSDVMALRDLKVGISVANMSAGYYNPHSDYEYIDLEDLERVTQMMIEIARTMTRSFPFRYFPPKRKFFGKVTSPLGTVKYWPPYQERFPDWEKGSNTKGVTNGMNHPPPLPASHLRTVKDEEEDDIQAANELWFKEHNASLQEQERLEAELEEEQAAMASEFHRLVGFA